MTRICIACVVCERVFHPRIATQVCPACWDRIENSRLRSLDSGGMPAA